MANEKREFEKVATGGGGVMLLELFSPHYMVFPSMRALKVGATPGEGNCGPCTRLELRTDGTVIASFGERRMVLAAAGWGWVE